jgi:hypothetical protein
LECIPLSSMFLNTANSESLATGNTGSFLLGRYDRRAAETSEMVLDNFCWHSRYSPVQLMAS